MAQPTTTTETLTKATVQTESAPSGIAALGVNAPLLAAQIVNFLLLLIILRFVLYQPLLGMLRKRRETIEAGVKAAEEAEQKAQAAARETAEQLAQARTQAKQIVDEAKAQAETVAAEVKSTAGQEAEAILARTRAQLTKEREAIVAAAETELGELVVRAAEKVLGQQKLTVDAKDVAAALAAAKEAQ